MEAKCHCGQVRIDVPRPPEWVAACNCSLCSKLGTLWAYYPDAEVSVERRALWRFNLATLQANKGDTVAARKTFQSLVDELQARSQGGRLLDESQRGLAQLGAAMTTAQPRKVAN